MGFIKVHLKKPHIDGVTLPRGTYAFTLEMEDRELIIGKIEKIYKFVIQAQNL